MRTNYSFVWISFLSLVFLVHHCFFFYGHFGYDDMHYARLSVNLLNGSWDMLDHYSHRLTVICLTSLSYSIFGINDFAGAFFPLLMSIAICMMILHVLSKHGTLIQALGLTLYFIYQWSLFYSDKLMADIYVSFFMTMAYYSHWLVMSGKMRSTHGAIILGSAMLCSFWAKGTFILLLPLFFFLFITDFSSERLQHFWMIATVTIAIIGSIYLSWNYVLFDNPLIRLDMIERGSYVNECSYAHYGVEKIVERVTFDFGKFIVEERLYIYLILMILVVALQKKSPHSKVFRSNDIVTILIIVLSMNFMTISVREYNPFCLDPRHFMMTIPILSIAAARIISTVSKPIQKGTLFIAVLFLYPTLQYSIDSRRLNYPQIKESILMTMDQIVHKESPKVFASQVMINLMDYYSGFKLGSRLELIDIELIESIECGDIVIRNWFAEFHSNLDPDKYDVIISGYTDLTDNEKSRLSLYQRSCD